MKVFDEVISSAFGYDFSSCFHTGHWLSMLPVINRGRERELKRALKTRKLHD
jgi:hypothetical protein